MSVSQTYGDTSWLKKSGSYSILLSIGYKVAGGKKLLFLLQYQLTGGYMIISIGNETKIKQIPFPNKKYQIIYADPPWDVKRGPEYASNGPSRILTYPTMKTKDIINLPIKELADKNCKLFLWTINKYLPIAFKVMQQWGFRYSTTLIWCKNPNGIGLGGTFSLTNEYLLFGVKGKVGAKKRYDTTWWIEKRGRHSQKPLKFRQIIEQAFPDDNKIELFAREKPIGWDVWGDEV